MQLGRQMDREPQIFGELAEARSLFDDTRDMRQDDEPLRFDQTVLAEWREHGTRSLYKSRLTIESAQQKV